MHDYRSPALASRKDESKGGRHTRVTAKLIRRTVGVGGGTVRANRPPSNIECQWFWHETLNRGASLVSSPCDLVEGTG